ncbi:MAG: DUF3467 domain-containing protein [Anaerolineae bacterium]|nr:DUF3467 domain-containing protein [Anaerolineae bacterium]
MQTPPPQPQRKLNLELPANLSVVYANAVVINQTNSEIILDFLQIMPNDPRARVLSRIVMTPVNAKLFLNALGVNLEHFEKAHGVIQLPAQPVSLADQLFGGLKPEDNKDEPTNE